MLGLADRAKIIDLFEALMRADLPRALAEVREQYDTGADPAMVLGDLAEFTHFVTRVKIVPALADDVSLTEAERTRGRDFAAKLSMRVLARTWQMLLKGLEEVAAAGRPLAAAEMVLVRIAYAADLPTPDEVIRSLGDGARGNGAGAASGSQASPRADMPARTEARSEMPRGGTARGACCRAGRNGSAGAAGARRRNGYAGARACELRGRWWRWRRKSVTSASRARSNAMCGWCASKTAGSNSAWSRARRNRLTGDLSKKLADWTGRRWMVIVSAEQGQPSLYAQAQTRKAELKDDVRADPLVQAVLTRFPGAEIVDVRAAADASAARRRNCRLIRRQWRSCGRRSERIEKDRHPEVAAKRPSRMHGPGRRPSRLATLAPQGDGTTDREHDGLIFSALMKQAAELKSKMEAMQAELDRIEVEGTAGGGLVTMTLSGKGEVQGVQDR